MICPYCLNTDFEVGLFDEPVMLYDRLVLFRNVPALRCTQCDELVFGPESGRLKDRALAEGPTSKLAIDSYDLATTAGTSVLENALATIQLRQEKAQKADKSKRAADA